MNKDDKTPPPKETKKVEAETKPTRLYRSEKDRIVGGVAAGIGEYLKIDPVVFRIILIILGLQGGGILLYLILWLIIPTKSKINGTEDTIRENVDEIKGKAKAFANDLKNEPKNQSFKLWLGMGVIALGILIFLDNLGWFHFFKWDKFWPLLLVFLGIAILKKGHSD